jgi:MYXO-CTERM domain-containing protein
MTSFPMRTAALAALTLGHIANSGAAQAVAIPTNLSGWQTAGDVSVQAGSVRGANLGTTTAFVLGTASAVFEDDTLATAGAYNLSGQSAVDAGQPGGVESAVGLPLGMFGTEAYEGSSLGKSFSLQAGDSIHFEYRLLTRTADADIASVNDSAWFTSASNGGLPSALAFQLADLNALTGATRSNGWLDSGWLSFDLAFTQSQQLTLGWAVVDQGSYADTSLLAVRGLSMTAAVPEPESWGLAVLSLGLLAAARRRAR